MELNPMDTTPKKGPEPFKPWEEQERMRPPWVPVEHGEQVLPPNDQKSNLKLSDDEVMQSRTEPVGQRSYAPPLNGRDGIGQGSSDEPSGSKRTYPTGH